MARITKAERTEAIERLKGWLKDCGPDGSASLMISENWHGSSTPQVDVRILRARDDNGGRPTLEEWLTFNVSKALGYRFSERNECILMGGCGYSRTTELAMALTKACGHPLFLTTQGAAFAPNGWFPKAPEVK